MKKHLAFLSDMRKQFPMSSTTNLHIHQQWVNDTIKYLPCKVDPKNPRSILPSDQIKDYINRQQDFFIYPWENICMVMIL